MSQRTRTVALSGMFCAISYLLMFVGRIPITSVDFLKYDPKDAVIALAAFIMGPWQALLITCVVSVLEMVTVSATGPIGLLMNVLGTAAFACTAGAIYRSRRTLKSAVAGLAAGMLTMTAVMLIWNYLITPLYMGYPREAIAAMLPTVFLPFNLIKSALNAALALLLYKPVIGALRGTGLVEKGSGGAAHAGLSKGVAAAALVVLVTCVLAVLAMRGLL